MDKIEKYTRRAPRPKGYWGKWRGVQCKECDKPASARGFCDEHYGKWRWKEGIRPPSANPRSYRNSHLRHRYGIGLADYEALVKSQEGLCAICKQPPGINDPKTWGGKLCVDHCHTTGKVRGLLCNNCNYLVRKWATENILLAAAKYVQNNS